MTELRLSHVLFNSPNGQLPTIERLHLSNMFELKPIESWPKISHIFPNITELNSSVPNTSNSGVSNYFPRLVNVNRIGNFYLDLKEDDPDEDDFYFHTSSIFQAKLIDLCDQYFDYVS